MNIIFDDAKDFIPDSYTLLELDTFRSKDTGKIYTAWCVVETIPLSEFSTMAEYCKIHEDLMDAYRNQNWEYCESAIKDLKGRWNGDLDSFYDNLLERVNNYQSRPFDNDWDPVIVRD